MATQGAPTALSRTYSTPAKTYEQIRRNVHTFESVQALVGGLEIPHQTEALRKIVEERAATGDAIALFVLGHFFRMRGQPLKTTETYRAAIAKAPGNGWLKRALGLYLANLGRLDEALSLLEAALANSGAADEGWVLLRDAVELAIRNGDHEGVMRIFAAARQLRVSADLELLTEEARALKAAGAFDPAEAVWKKVLARTNPRDDEHLEAVKSLGAILERRGAVAAALRLYESLLKKLPGAHWIRAEILDHLVDVYRQQGTLEHLLTSVHRLAKGLEGALTRGRILEELGRQPQAARIYETLLRRFPYAPEPYARLIHILRLRGDTRRVAKLLRTQIKKMPGEIRLSFQLARILGDLGERDESIALLARTAKRFNHDPGVQGEVVDLLIRLKAPRKTVLARFARLRHLEPHDPTHVEALGAYLYGQHRLDEARRVWEDLLIMTEHPAEGHLRLAQILEEHHFSEYAQEYYLKALEIAPDDLDVLSAVALWREDAHKPEEAMALWQHVLKLDPEIKDEITRTAMDHLLDLHSNSGGLRAQVKALRKACAPGVGPTLSRSVFLVRSLARIGEVDHALEEGERLSHEVTRPKVLLQTMLHLARNSGRHEVVLRLIAVLLKIDPRAALSLSLERAEILTRLERFAEAQRAIEEVLGSTPDDPETLVRVADLQEEMGDIRRATAILQQAQSLHPDTMNVAFRLADLYRRLGQLEAERKTLERVVRVAHRPLDITRAGRRLIRLARTTTHLNELDRALSPALLRSDEYGANRSLWLDIQLRRARIDEAANLIEPGLETKVPEPIGSIRLVTEALALEDSANRLKALEILAHAPPPGVDRLLARCLDDPDEEIRLRSFRVLGKNPTAKTYALLWKKILSPEVRDRVDLPTFLGAIWVLGRVPISVEIQWSRMMRPREQRNITLGLLLVASMRKDPGALPLIEKGLESPKPLIRGAAIFALSRLGDAAPKDLVENTLNALTSERGLPLMSARYLARSQTRSAGGRPLARALVNGLEDAGIDLRALYPRVQQVTQKTQREDAWLDSYWSHALVPTEAKVGFESLLQSVLSRGLSSGSGRRGELDPEIIEVLDNALREALAGASPERRTRYLLRLAEAGDALRLDEKGALGARMCAAFAKTITSSRKADPSPVEMGADLALLGDCRALPPVDDFARAFDRSERMIQEMILRRIHAHQGRTPSHLRAIADSMRDSGLRILWLEQAQSIKLRADDDTLVEWLTAAPGSLISAILEHLKIYRDEELPAGILRALQPAAKTRAPEVRALLLQTLCHRAPGSPETWPEWMHNLASALDASSSTSNIFCRAE